MRLVTTNKVKVLLAHRVQPEWLKLYQTLLPPTIEIISPSELTPEHLETHAPDIDIFVGYKATEGFLEKARKLKHIQVPWTGSETLDFELLQRYPKITVSNSHSNSLAIAEHAVALLMAVSKQIVRSDTAMRKGDWSTRYDDTFGYWVSNKILGVLGFGWIGQHVARMMSSGFGMKVHAIKRDPSSIPKDVVYDVLKGPEYLEELLKTSDYLLVALPLTKETRGLLGAHELALMKPNCVIVNISRGPIFQEEDLFTHLKEKRIAGAGIDTWWVYPKDRNNPVQNFQNFPFAELENVVMTPHSAFKIHDRAKVFIHDTVQNILRISRNEQPSNQLNLTLGY